MDRLAFTFRPVLNRFPIGPCAKGTTSHHSMSAIDGSPQVPVIVNQPRRSPLNSAHALLRRGFHRDLDSLGDRVEFRLAPRVAHQSHVNRGAQTVLGEITIERLARRVGKRKKSCWMGIKAMACGSEL